MDVLAVARALRDWRRTLGFVGTRYKRLAEDRRGQDADASAVSSELLKEVQAQGVGPPNPALVHIGAGLAIVLGIVTQVALITSYRQGKLDLPAAILIFSLGAGLAAAGFWHYYSVFAVGAARRAQLAQKLEQNPGAPWLLDDAWAERKVVDRSGASTCIFLWVWTIGWWVFCGFLWDFNLQTIAAAAGRSWLEGLLIVFLVVAGILGLAAAIATTVRWFRYGASTLHIDSLPGYLGNRFRGSVSACIRDDAHLEAEVACERVSVVWIPAPKGGRSKKMIRTPLWAHRWPLERDRMTRMKNGDVIIPIDVPLPEDQPPYAIDADGAGIRWMLRIGRDLAAANPSDALVISAPGLGGFSAEYSIPVYARR